MLSDASLREFLASEPRVLFACLYGSQVAARARPDSDWDIGVYLDAGLSPDQRFRERLRLSAALGDSADVVILNDAPPLLAHRALQGRLLCAPDRTAYVRFFIRTLGESEDQRYFDQIHWQARQQRLEDGSFGRP